MNTCQKCGTPWDQHTKEAVRAALEEFGDAVNDALIIGEVITIDKIVLMRRIIRDILAKRGAKP